MFGDRVSDGKVLICIVAFLMLATSMISVEGHLDHYAGEIGTNSPPPYGNWTVSGNEVYTDTQLIVNGNLSISGSLFLDNTSLVINRSGSVLNTIYVLNGASLVLRNGSIITGNGSAPFFMEVHGNTYVEINGSKINGCGAAMPESEKNGVYVETDRFYLNNSIISEGFSGIIGSGATISISGSVIRDMISNGIHLEEGSISRIQSLNLTNINGAGVMTTNSTLDADDLVYDFCNEGIYSVDSQIKLMNSAISAMGPRAIFFDSTNAEIIDCYPGIGGTDMLQTGGFLGPSIVKMLNTSLSMIEIFDDSTATESFRLDFQVRTNNRKPAEMADVELYDSDGNIEWQGLTSEDGWILDRPVVGIIHNRSGVFLNDPHTISVLYEGAIRSKQFNVSEGHYQIIDVIINDPEIEIISPENNSWSSTRSITIEGRITDDREIVSLGWFLDDGHEVIIHPGKNFMIELLFGDDGEHDIRVRCMNDDGKFGEDVLHFGIDTIDPSLEVTYPEDGIFVNSSILSVEGYCEPGSKLYIDDLLVPHPAGTFSHDIFLSEGENLIVIKSVDRAGNTVTITRRVHLDTTPPFIRIFTPVNGTITRNNWIIIEGAVSHDTEELMINDDMVDFDLKGFSHRIEGLSEGNNLIRISAIDRTGSMARSYLWIFVDTMAPSLSLISLPKYTNSNVIQLSGITEEGATVLVNGNQATLDGTRFTANVDLHLGRNNISVSSADQAGNSITLFYDIIMDTEKPTFERISPLDRSNFQTMVITIEGRVYDDHGIKIIKGFDQNGIPVELSSEIGFEWVVTLESGENLFTIEAEDLAGNKRTTTLHYSYDPGSTADRIKPRVKITEPFANDTLEEGYITIKGTASDDTEIFRVRVRIDRGNWINANGTSNWTIQFYLSKGVHIIEAMAEDTSANSENDMIKVMVVSMKEEEIDSEQGDLSFIFTAIGSIIIIVAILLLVYLFIRNQKLREEWTRERQEIHKEKRQKRKKRPRQDLMADPGEYIRNGKRIPARRRPPENDG